MTISNNLIFREAAMFELTPILCGAVLELLHLRARIDQRTLQYLAVLAACVATAASGEPLDAPQLILVHLALVAAGIVAIRLLASHPRVGRSLRAVPAPAHVHTTLPVRTPHLRSTRKR